MGVAIGKHSYGMPKIIGKGGNVTIGNFTSIADYVEVITVGHNHKNISTYPFNIGERLSAFPYAKGISTHPVKYGDTIIGNDVWIGHRATLKGGCQIGDGSVIAAGTLVTRDVEPYEIVAGTNCRRIGFRFSPNVIKKLLKIDWWYWSDKEINEIVPFLMSSDIDGLFEFIKRKEEL